MRQIKHSSNIFILKTSKIIKCIKILLEIVYFNSKMLKTTNFNNIKINKIPIIKIINSNINTMISNSKSSYRTN